MNHSPESTNDVSDEIRSSVGLSSRFSNDSDSARATAHATRTSFGHVNTTIELRGLRVHNLKNLDLDIPLNQLVVISGVSGSGKSSLAFDTLFAEGQRRYIESFSIASRRHLASIERPDADRIANVPVSLAIRSDASLANRIDSRSTVGTITELFDGLRVLFSRVGRTICPGCGCEIRSGSSSDIVQIMSALPTGTRCQLVFAVNDGEASEPVSNWLTRGFSRGIWGGATHELSGTSQWPSTGGVWLVADRFVVGKANPERIRESAEAGFREGKGRVLLLVASDELETESPRQPVSDDSSRKEASTTAKKDEPRLAIQLPESQFLQFDGKRWRRHQFSRRLECFECNRAFLPLEPRLFSHLSSGACSTCRGVGQNSDGVRCPDCHGTRYRTEAMAVKVANQSIADLCKMNPSSVLDFVKNLSEILDHDGLNQIAVIRRDIERRLRAVCELGLDYLTLDRSTATLSGGESRRLMLAAVIGAGITGTLVVVDEPSAGLAVSELPLIVTALRRVQSLRNSVIAVDHSPGIVAAADHVIELGPGAGPLGGGIVYQGHAQGYMSSMSIKQGVIEVDPSAGQSAENIAVTKANSLKSPRTRPAKGKSDTTNKLILRNVRHHNLQDFCVEFPLGQLCVVSGVSGSGKTSLVTQVLYPAVCDHLQLPCKISDYGQCEISGCELLVDVILIDQSPLTKSSRSNPATWLEVFDEIRQTFATTADARQRGFGPQQFSFNSPSGGRCRSCLGTGLLKQDMQFLPDVTLTCPECRGTRYRPEILEVKYRGRSIADVLAMSVSEAASFFRSQPRLQSRFQLVKQIGLEYLVLGQPSETLSGGEAQRLKIAARLATSSNGESLIICDESTTGLHPRGVRCLITCFRELIANGHSLILADNSPELLAEADYIVEM